MALTKVPNELSSTPSIVDGGNSTAITITSDDNVLAGKTATDYNTAGIEIDGANNRLFVTRAGTPVLINRKSSDGQLVSFYRDTAEVGSIGAAPHNRFYIGNGDAGIRFLGDSNLVTPWRPDTNANSDNLLDLGNISNRWRNVWVAGGIYLGGTAAANKISDYEFGNWVPTFHAYTGSLPSTLTTSNAGTYTKVGRMVSLTGYLQIDSVSGASSNIINIRGLPFTVLVGNGNHQAGAFTASSINFARTTNLAITTFGTTELGFLTSNNNAGWGWEYFNILNNGSFMRFEITYYTSE